MTRTTKRRSGKRSSMFRDRALSPREAERIRPGRVLAAQARIASGYYDRPEVRDCLVEVLLRELLRH